MTVNELFDHLGGLDVEHCGQVRDQSLNAILAAPDFAEVRQAFNRDHHGLPDRDWLESKRCQLKAAGYDYNAVGQMELAAFCEAVVQLSKRPQASPEKLFPKGLPSNPDLADCIVMLDTKRDGKTADMVWLLEFFGNDERKAKLMQEEIKRARHEGLTSLPANTKRYSPAKRP